MIYTTGNVEIAMSPRGRGAGHSVRDQILKLYTGHQANHILVSQQVSDKAIISGLATAANDVRGKSKVFMESLFLTEGEPLQGDAIWQSEGKNEKNRQALLALLRSGFDVRTDIEGSALMHINYILAEDSARRECVVTSANLTQNSIDRHLNWGVFINDKDICDYLRQLYETIYSGAFAKVDDSIVFDRHEKKLRCSSAGGVIQEISSLVKSARRRIVLAYFNISTSSEIVEELTEAAQRGVEIFGVVDGDQRDQLWDALPELKANGVEIRYYPGQMTGAPGRMHYKMMVCDDQKVHLGTANISKAAETSLELGFTLEEGGAAAYVTAEIERLYAGAYPNL